MCQVGEGCVCMCLFEILSTVKHTLMLYSFSSLPAHECRMCVNSCWSSSGLWPCGYTPTHRSKHSRVYVWKAFIKGREKSWTCPYLSVCVWGWVWWAGGGLGLFTFAYRPSSSSKEAWGGTDPAVRPPGEGVRLMKVWGGGGWRKVLMRA